MRRSRNPLWAISVHRGFESLPLRSTSRIPHDKAGFGASVKPWAKVPTDGNGPQLDPPSESFFPPAFPRGAVRDLTDPSAGRSSGPATCAVPGRIVAIARWDRSLVYETRGHRFESCRARFTHPALQRRMAHCKRDHATFASRGHRAEAGSARASAGRDFTPHVPSTFPRQG